MMFKMCLECVRKYIKRENSEPKWLLSGPPMGHHVTKNLCENLTYTRQFLQMIRMFEKEIAQAIMVV